MKSTEQTRAAAQAVLDYIHTYPEAHDQEVVKGEAATTTPCGTSMCIAGTAIALKNNIKSLLDWEDYWDEKDLGAQSHSDAAWVKEAREILGLDEDEAIDLFFEYDEETAVQKLKHVVVGEEWQIGIKSTW